MKLFRRVFSLLLCAALLLGMTPAVFAANATSGTCGTDLTWSYDAVSKTLTISGSGDGTMTNYTTSNNKTTAPWVAYAAEIQHLVVNSGVTTIGSQAFRGLSALTDVSLPAGLTRLGGYAFAHCPLLASIALPDGVTSISGYACAYDTGLSFVILGSNISGVPATAFTGCSGLKDVYYKGTAEQWNSINSNFDASVAIHTDWSDAVTLRFYLSTASDAPFVTETYTIGTPLIPPYVPTKAGTTFAGWKDIDGNEIPATVPMNSNDYYAQWVYEDYTARFLVPNDETGEYDVYHSVIGPVGTNIEKPADPEKEGRTFSKWTKTNQSAALSFPQVMPAADVDFAASFTANKYTVYWVVDGTTVSSGQYSYGASFADYHYTPPAGKTFSGWEAHQNTVPAYDYYIHGTTSTNTYTATWMVDNAAVEQSALTVGDPVSAPVPPQKVGYIFTGWTPEVPATMPAEDQTFYAVYEQDHTANLQMTIRFRRFDAQSGQWVETTRAKPGEELQLLYYVNSRYYTLSPDVGFAFDKQYFTIGDYSAGDQLSGVSACNADYQNHALQGAAYDAVWWPESSPALRRGVSLGILTQAEADGMGFVSGLLNQPDGTAALMLTDDDWLVKIDRFKVQNNNYVKAAGRQGVAYVPAEFYVSGGASAHPGVYSYPLGEEGSSSTADLRVAGTGWGFVPASTAGTISVFSNLVLHANGGTFGGEATKTLTGVIGAPVGDLFAAANRPTREKKALVGWSRTPDGAVLSDEELAALTFAYDDAVLYAVWGPPIYKVTVDYSDGSEPLVFSVMEDDTFSLDDEGIYEPTRDGYSFEGWEYWGVDHADSFIMPNHDVTITAVYNLNQYTLTLDPNGGELSRESEYTVYYSDPLSGYIEDPAREGYNFIGWYSDEYGMIGPDFTMPAYDLTLVAQWEAKDYHVLYYADGVCVSDYTVHYNEEIPQPDPPEKEGCTFVGWTPEIPATMPAEDLTIYAVFTENSYKIKWDFGGASWTQTAVYGAEITPPDDPEREGFVFRGWYPPVPAVMPGENQIFTAQWRAADAVTYPVVFEADGAAILTDAYTAGERLLPPEAPEKAGYTCTGWSPALPEFSPAAAQTYTAVYTPNPYHAVFYGNGGAFGAQESVTREIVYGQPVTSPAAPQRTGYTFTGWTPALPAAMPANDLEFRAQWTINTYTYTFMNDGAVFATAQYQYGAQPQLPAAAPEKFGYVFEGWSPALPTAATEDATFFAVWTHLQATATFDAAGGAFGDTTAVQTLQVGVGDPIPLPAAPTRTGHRFTGWDPAPGTMPMENQTFTAQWEEIPTHKLSVVLGSQVLAQFEIGEGEPISLQLEQYQNAVKSKFYGLYQFDSWLWSTPDGEAPAVMPDHDVAVYALLRLSHLHETVLVDTVAPTMNERGYIGDTYCPSCGICLSLSDELILPAVSEISTKTPSGGNESEPTAQISWSYDTATDSLTISGTGRIPNYSDTNNVTTAPWRQYAASMRALVIETGVTSIGYKAFYGCTGLTSVTIPDSVTSIDNYAFYGCTGLTSVTIPDSVTSIGDSAFYYCTGLTSVTIPDSVISIGDDAFRGCTGLTSVTIGNGVMSIGSYAFEDCTGLTSVTIPDSVAIIGYKAFYNTSYYNSNANWDAGVLYNGHHLIEAKTSLSGAYAIRPGTISIAGGAFAYCSELTTVTIPDSVTSIGGSPFYGCTGLKTAGPIGGGYSIEFGLTTAIPAYAFSGCTGLTSVTIPDSVTSIGDYAFYGCTGLTSVTIPDSVTSIGDGAFYGCKGLTNVTIGNGVTSIGSSAFEYCTGLTSVTIGNGVTSIGSSAFEYCTGLTSVTIPDSVKSIDNYAFYGCTRLTSVTISDSVTSIGDSAFDGCTGLTSVTIGNGVTSIGYSAFYGCKGLTNVTIGNGVTSIDNYAFYGCTGLASVTIGNGVTSIGNYAFKDCTGLTSITLPDSVTSIGSSAFSGCTGLTSVTIGNSVTSIGDDAFSGCTGLTSITIPDSVTSIGEEAFENCTGLTSVTIGNGVTSIGDYAFSGCTGLTSITVGVCAATISSTVFGYGALKNLERVNFNGTIAEWCGLEIYSSINEGYTDDGNPLLSAAKHLYIQDREFTEIRAEDLAGVTRIGAGAFAGLKTLTRVELPDSIVEIGDFAFSGCVGLTEMELPDSVRRIGIGAFRGCRGLTEITIPAQLKQLGGLSFAGCTALHTVHYLAEDCMILINPYVIDDEFVAFLNALGYLCSPFAMSGVQEVEIGPNVERLPADVFAACPLLAAVRFPDSALSIHENAFIWNDTYGIELVDNSSLYVELYRIDSYDQLMLLDSEPSPVFYVYEASYAYSFAVENGYEYALYDAEAGTAFRIKNNALRAYTGTAQHLVLPGDVTAVSSGAFKGNAVPVTIELPYSVTTIGAEAFADCANLTSVIVPFTVTSIGKNAFANTNAKICCYYNSYAYRYAVKNSLPYELITVSFASPEAAVGLNSTLQLSAAPSITLACGLPLVFQSANPGVAAVSPDGQVTGVAPGETTVSVYTEQMQYLSSCKVTVTPDCIHTDGNSDGRCDHCGVKLRDPFPSRRMMTLQQLLQQIFSRVFAIFSRLPGFKK